ncbi:hypothetical protein D3C72_1436510 [compost metagenome]
MSENPPKATAFGRVWQCRVIRDWRQAGLGMNWVSMPRNLCGIDEGADQPIVAPAGAVCNDERIGVYPWLCDGHRLLSGVRQAPARDGH